MGSRGRSRSSTRGSSEVVLEGGSWFGSTLASSASQRLDGVAEVEWRSFNGVTLVWIDVELTGAASSWLGDGGKGVAVRIRIGPFQASTLWGLISDRCGSDDLFWRFCKLVKQSCGQRWWWHTVQRERRERERENKGRNFFIILTTLPLQKWLEMTDISLKLTEKQLFNGVIDDSDQSDIRFQT